MDILGTLSNLVAQTAFFNLTVGNYIMILVALFFLYLAIAKGYEPLLLVPIAFGMLLVNIYPDIIAHPSDMSNGTGGLLYYFYQLDEWSILPSLIFMGVGAMTDFGPLMPFCSDSTVSPQLPSPSSAELTARLPSSLHPSSDRRLCSVRSRSLHILICRSSRSSSRLS